MKSHQKKNWIGNPKLIHWYIFKHLFKILCIVLIFLGLCFVFESSSETEIPDFCNLKNSEINPHLVSNSFCIRKDTPHIERFHALNNALKILDETNPIVSKWVRNQNNINKLFFVEENKSDINFYAKFNWMNQSLCIHKRLFAESDGEIAVTLAHEYRHSRQHYTKMIRYAFSTFWSKDGEESIIENDAYLYEMKAYSAIFGTGYDYQ